MKRRIGCVFTLVLAISGCPMLQDLITPRAATPTFAPAQGTYTTVQSVTISCATSGASIRYTLDGSDPTAANATVYDGSAISISKTTTIKALATKEGMSDSSIGSSQYTINIPQVAAPVIYPPPGVYYNSVSMMAYITCATAGATIMYTVDGTRPSKTNGADCSNRSESGLDLHQWESPKLLVMAYRDGMLDSEVVSGGFVIPQAGMAQIYLGNKSSTIITKIFLKRSSESAWGVNQYYRRDWGGLPPDYFWPINYLQAGWMDLKVENDSGSFSETYMNIPLLDNASTTVDVR